MLAPFASGAASVIVLEEKLLLKPPPLGCPVLGAVLSCSSVVPITVMLLFPTPHGGRSTFTTRSADVIGLRSAKPDAAGKVSRSIIL